MEQNKENIAKPGVDVLFAYLRETASKEECRWVEQWMEVEEANEKLLMRIAAIYYARHTQERIQARNPLVAFKKVCKKRKRRKETRFILRVTAVAACILTGVLLSSLWHWKSVPDFSEPQIVTLRSNPGTRVSFNLPDGTVVYLNSGTELSYPFPYDKTQRKVFLKGEAYFKVKSNPSQPFIVSTAKDRVQVKVLGTEFNVRALTGERTIETTLITGSVDLSLIKGNGSISNQMLHPSEKATVDLKEERLHIEKVNTQYLTAWKEGKLVFKECPLPKVLKELSYFYNVKFKVEDPVIETYCFTGTFQDKQLFQVLDYLKITSKINYVILPSRRDDSLGVEYTTVILGK